MWNKLENENYSLVKKLIDHKECVTSVSLRIDGKYMFSGSDDGIIKIWSL